MNVRPGDLAILVGGECPEYYGQICKVLRPYDGPEFIDARGPQWWVLWRDEEYHCEDLALKPLRDPGEDAQDESRAWLPPVPTQHKETA